MCWLMHFSQNAKAEPRVVKVSGGYYMFAWQPLGLEAVQALFGLTFARHCMSQPLSSALALDLELDFESLSVDNNLHKHIS